MILFETHSEMSSRCRALGPVVGLIIVCGAAAAWFAWDDRAAPSSDSAPSGSPTAEHNLPITVIVSGDTAGWIVPCGCTSNQSGGLPRRGTLVGERRQQGPVLVADVGGAPGGTSPYQRARFEAILGGELAMEIAAHNLGEPELALGIDYLRKLADEKKIPFISANLRDADNRPAVEPYRVVEAGGVRVLFIGISPVKGGRSDKGYHLIEPREAVLAALAAARGKFDWSIVLAYLPERGLRELAEALPEVDAIIGGPTGQSLTPERRGATLVASATNKGKFVVALSLPANSDRPSAPSAAVVELSKAFTDDPAQSENVRAFRRELTRRDFSASESGFAPPLSNSPADNQVAGTAACLACHAEEHDIWSRSSHARAWETIAADDAQADPFCQQCHTTGYGLAGGFQSRTKGAGLVSVGCESCHGPALAHAKRPEKHAPMNAREQCTKCHDHENSPEFEFAGYWRRIEH